MKKKKVKNHLNNIKPHKWIKVEFCNTDETLKFCENLISTGDNSNIEIAYNILKPLKLSTMLYTSDDTVKILDVLKNDTKLIYIDYPNNISIYSNRVLTILSKKSKTLMGLNNELNLGIITARFLDKNSFSYRGMFNLSSGVYKQINGQWYKYNNIASKKYVRRS